ncbi:MAG: DEAD/DEAH box helicase [Myxococcaceae bacterium]
MTAPISDFDDTPGFEAFGLREPLLKALANLGYEEPTPIQREAMPHLLAGRDVLGQAATGTGKTAAFALPLLNRIEVGKAGPFSASALVLVPTRELAVQVAEAIHSYSKEMGVSVLAVYGGQDIGQQLRQLKRGADVVVATPGRAVDHLRRRTLKLENVRTVVLDEADEMLDMGFAEDLDALLSSLPEERQTALFSATLPPRIAAIAERHLKKPAKVKIAQEKLTAGELPKVRQTAYFVAHGQKNAALGRVLDVETPRSAIVFCRTRTEVETLTEHVTGLGFKAQPLHGGMSQDQRDRVLKMFKTGRAEILVATDVAARGLHIEKLSHVVNYDLPTAPEAYVHRIGRTGRAGEEGVAISFASPRERRLLKNIERVTGQRIDVAALPTVADLRAKKQELLSKSLREMLASGKFETVRSVAEGLASEFAPLDIAAAALKLAQLASGEDRDNVPELDLAPPPQSRFEERPRGRLGRDEEKFSSRGRSDGAKLSSRGRADRDGDSGPRRFDREARLGGERGPAHFERARAPRGAGFDVVKLFIGAGHSIGIRPADIVGAIANEAGLKAQQIGSIQISEMHSVVEVPKDQAAHVLSALKSTTLRGRKVKVDKFRGYVSNGE